MNLRILPIKIHKNFYKNKNVIKFKSNNIPFKSNKSNEDEMDKFLSNCEIKSDKSTMIKNHVLNDELNIAGKFIYDGLKDLNKAEQYNDTADLFCYLYKTSVGIERLQKVAYILLKNPNDSDYEKVADEVHGLSHNHTEINKKIESICNGSKPFPSVLNEYLSLLDVFYKNNRYGKFSFDSSKQNENILLMKYADKYLNNKNDNNNDTNRKIDDRTKKFLAKTTDKLVKHYYEIIYGQSKSNYLMTHHATNPSAFKVFDCKYSNLDTIVFDEKLAHKEFLIYLLNNLDDSDFLNYLRKIPPLKLNPNNSKYNMLDILNGNIPVELLSEIEDLYSKSSDFKPKDRIKLLSEIDN